MKFHRRALISYVPCPSKSTCPLGVNQAFEGLIRLSICCQLCSFSANYGYLGQVIYVTKLICIHSGCSHREIWTKKPLASVLFCAHTKQNKQTREKKQLSLESKWELIVIYIEMKCWLKSLPFKEKNKKQKTIKFFKFTRLFPHNCE